MTFGGVGKSQKQPSWTRCLHGFIWCYTRTPRGGDGTGRSKITHYRGINECWGQQEERWRGAHISEMYQQPWNEMVWIFIRILKSSGAPGEAAVVRTSWKKSCAGSRDLGLQVTCQGPPHPQLWNEEIVSVNPPKSLINPIFTDYSIILSLYCFWSALKSRVLKQADCTRMITIT